MRRYVSLDVLRGVSIAGMIFVHILEDIYNMNWTNSDQQIGILPMVAVIMLMVGLIFRGWAGLFLMVSMASNMISMYNNLERGKTIASVVLKQVLGGFILLIFSFLCEGTLQYYGLSNHNTRRTRLEPNTLERLYYGNYSHNCMVYDY